VEVVKPMIKMETCLDQITPLKKAGCS